MDPNFNNLIGKYLNGSLSSRELQQLNSLLQKKERLDELEQMILAELRQDHPAEEGDPQLRNAILEKLEKQMAMHDDEQAAVIPVNTTRRRLGRFLAAASV